MSQSPHLGKWYKTNKDGDFEEINVIEVEGDIARTVGKNFSVSELKKSWLRQNQIAPDPFAMDLGNAIPDLIKKDFVVKTEEHPLKLEPATILDHAPVAQPTVSKLDELANQSPQHKFLIDAIQLSNTESSIKLNIDLVLPCDLNAMKILLNTLKIDHSVLSEVLASMLNEKYSSKIQDAFGSSILDILDNVDFQ